MMGYYYTLGPGLGYFGMVFMTVFWIILILLIVWLIIQYRRREENVEDDPVTVLKLRYARGEIDKKTYDAMRRDLQNK